jgi:hypothetical protein
VEEERWRVKLDRVRKLELELLAHRRMAEMKGHIWECLDLDELLFCWGYTNLIAAEAYFSGIEVEVDEDDESDDYIRVEEDSEPHKRGDEELGYY